MLSTASPSSHSWFLQVRDLCKKYGLPDPLSILHNPPSKDSFKKNARLKVQDWWQNKYRTEAAPLKSLKYFDANYMSLSNPHPIWTSARHSQYEVKKAIVQARMLSGRYRTCWLRRHWSGDSAGVCRIPGCTNQPGTLLHLATAECPGLAAARVKAVAIWSVFLRENPHLFPIISFYSLGESENFVKFLLDPTTRPPVIALSQSHSDGQSEIIAKLCYLTRTWLFIMHKERLMLLNLW